MKKAFNFNFLNIIEMTIFLLLFAKLLSLFVWWYLPEIGVESTKNVSCVMPYQRVDFKNMLEHISTKKIKHKIKKHKVKKVITINELILKGLYGNKNYGYVIIANKKHPNKTSIISIGESYNGYKLKAIYLDYVIFNKNGKDYNLRLKQNKNKTKINIVKKTKKVAKVVYHNETALKKVNKKDINYYSHHFSDIWKDIAIDEIRKNGHIAGFLIKRIRPGSKMAQLGLKKGDIIIKANNQRLNSYKVAMDIYKNINKINTLNLVVKRGNEEKEITYEVH
jgi:type II secretion system protein C